MFETLGRWISRGWWLCVLVWLGLFVGVRAMAPEWDAVAIDREFAFLPADAPSRRGEELFRRAFPNDLQGSSVVLVVSREDEPLTEDDKLFIEETLRTELEKIAEEDGGLATATTTDDPAAISHASNSRSIIAQVHTLGEPGIGALLVSEDETTSLVIVELTTEFMEHGNAPTVDKIESMISQVRQSGETPEGLEIALSGSAVIGRDTTRAQSRGARDTEFWTVALVVGLLVVIYRSPMLAVIPLATVFFAAVISLKLLAILAGADVITLFNGIQVFITVLVYGAGVDYCLFLTARYKEELDGGASVHEALTQAIGRTGAALVASAGTVMCGIGMMVFAQFGKFHQAGVAIPFGLGIVLLGALTLAPALLRVAGRWAFWPHMPQARSPDQRITRRPEERSSGNLLQHTWEVKGQWLLRRPGTIWLASVLAMMPFAIVAVLWYNHLNFDLVSKLPDDAPSVVGTRKLQEHFPAGFTGSITTMVRNDKIDFSTPHGTELIDTLTTRLMERAEELGIVDIRSVSDPLGTTERAQAAIATMPAPPDEVERMVREQALAHYVAAAAQGSHVTRLEIILNRDPFHRDSIAGLDQIERAVRAELPRELRGSQLYAIGSTASIRDLKSVTGADQRRIEFLVLAAVLVILVVLLRSVVVPVYLIVSVFFSFLATMGVTIAVFWALDPSGFAGLDWRVPVFLFTILIAVGEDYNIFLMTRVREEQERHGVEQGVVRALARTGGIISSCGVIMAGTFASIMAGELETMRQLGFALAFGVLLDTFVVRPILVPAFLILMHRGWLGPLGRAARKRAGMPRETVAAGHHS